jgi:hypothetical protein
MKVFISFSHKNQPEVERVAARLVAAGIETELETGRGNWGDNLIEKISQGAGTADYLLVMLTPSYLESVWSQQELTTWRLKEVGAAQAFIVPVLLAPVDIPSVLQDRRCFDLCADRFESGITDLIDMVSRHEPIIREPFRKQIGGAYSKPQQLVKLREEYGKGNLSLFCGAGISMSAGIPNWSTLLKHLIQQLFSRVDEAAPTDTRNSLYNIYQDYFNLPPLVIAQYLKNGLGKDFKETVRNSLYVSSPETSPLIDTICEMCRPQRERKSLSSIVTFNFDDLIEHNLSRNRIRYKSIYSEGQRCLSSELPVYHVHGYLPRGSQIDDRQELVFSSDAYHTQFIDPFSWSNLTQLNHLNQNTCLFVGLSMTDPNLRRLLDVSMRKNPEKTLNHYAFKKRPELTDEASALHLTPLSKESEAHLMKLIEMAQILEEKDANSLGFNIIWVDNFDEIPDILHSLAEEPEAGAVRF